MICIACIGQEDKLASTKSGLVAHPLTYSEGGFVEDLHNQYPMMWLMCPWMSGRQQKSIDVTQVTSKKKERVIFILHGMFIG